MVCVVMHTVFSCQLRNLGLPPREWYTQLESTWGLGMYECDIWRLYMYIITAIEFMGIDQSC